MPTPEEEAAAAAAAKEAEDKAAAEAAAAEAEEKAAAEATAAAEAAQKEAEEKAAAETAAAVEADAKAKAEAEKSALDAEGPRGKGPATVRNSETKFNDERAKVAMAHANAAPDSAKQPPDDMDPRARRVYGTTEWRIPTNEDVLVSEVIVGSAPDIVGRQDIARMFSDTRRLAEMGKKAPGLEPRV